MNKKLNLSYDREYYNGMNKKQDKIFKKQRQIFAYSILASILDGFLLLIINSLSLPVPYLNYVPILICVIILIMDSALFIHNGNPYDFEAPYEIGHIMDLDEINNNSKDVFLETADGRCLIAIYGDDLESDNDYCYVFLEDYLNQYLNYKTKVPDNDKWECISINVDCSGKVGVSFS